MTLGGVIFFSCLGGALCLLLTAAIIDLTRGTKRDRRLELAAKTKRFLKEEHREHHNSQTSEGTFRFK